MKLFLVALLAAAATAQEAVDPCSPSPCGVNTYCEVIKKHHFKKKGSKNIKVFPLF